MVCYKSRVRAMFPVHNTQNGSARSSRGRSFNVGSDLLTPTKAEFLLLIPINSMQGRIPCHNETISAM